MRNFAGIVGDDPAVAVDPVGLRDAGEAVVAERRSAAVPERDVVRVELAEEFASVTLEVLHVDSEEHDAPRVQPRGVGQAGCFRFAGAAPGRPEVDHDWIAAKLSQGYLRVDDGGAKLSRPRFGVRPDDGEIEARCGRGSFPTEHLSRGASPGRGG